MLNLMLTLVMQTRLYIKYLKKNQIETPDNKEIIALIAYLQRLGTDIKVGAASSTAPQPGGNP